MEQNDSLKQELKNLARIEEEQKQLLKEMNMAQRAEMVKAKDVVSANANMSYTPPQNIVSYGDMPPYEPYQVDYTPSYAKNSFNNATGNIMNPFGQQSRMATDYYKQIQNASKNSTVSIWDTITPSSKTSLRDRDLMGMEYGSRYGTAALTAIGSAASFGTNWFLAGAVPGLAGIGVSMAGGALVGAYTGLAVDESKQNNALAKYIYKTSNLYIDPKESNNERLIGGFSRTESYDAANFVRKMNDDFYMTDDDISTLLQEFTEGGMLRDVKDLKSFKERMSSLTKTVKEGAIILDETYESIAELMSDMKKMGIDSKNYLDFMSTGNLLSGLTGENGSETVRTQQDYLKNEYSGTDYNINDGLTRLKNQSIYVAYYYDQLENNDARTALEESNYNYIKNLGGPTQAAIQLDSVMNQIVKSDEFENPALMFFDYDKNQKDFVFNKEKYEDFMSGNYTLEQIYKSGSLKFEDLQLSGNAEAIDRWKNNAHSYVKNNLTGDMQTELIQKTLTTYANDPSLIAEGFDERTILSMFGITDSALQNFISGTLAYKDSNPNLVSQVNLQSMWQQSAAQNIAKTPSLTELASSQWEKVTDVATQWAVNLNQAAGEAVQKITDKISGYDRRVSPRYDQTFITRSEKLDSIEYEDVLKAREEVGMEVATTKYYLTELKNKGYKIDDNLMGYIDQKYNVYSDDTISYDRQVISDWDTVDKETSESKEYIQELAQKKDLSEIIVASLLKYNQQKPKDEKIDIEKMTSDIESNMIAYGGNEKMAVAASISPEISKTIDTALKSMGYDMQSLRSTGLQEVVANISLESLGLDSEILAQVKDLINQNIGASNGTGTNVELNGKSIDEIDFANMDLSAPSGLSVEQIQEIINKNTADKPDSILRQEGVAEAFYVAEKEHNVSAAFLLALSGQEGTWGASNIAKEKNNPFGWGAEDRNPAGLAKEWSSVTEGILSFAQSVSGSYINSDEHNQNTLQKMMAGSSTSPWHRYNDKQSWVDGNANLLEQIYKQAGDLNFTDSYEYVATKTENVYKDKDGNKLEQEQIDQINASIGFGVNTEDNQRLQKFLATADLVSGPTKYLEVSEEDLGNKLRDDFLRLKTEGAFDFATPIPGISLTSAPYGREFDLSMMQLIEKFVEKYDPSKSTNEILTRDEDIKGVYEEILAMFPKEGKKVGEEYINKTLAEVTVEKELQTKDRGYETLQSWGRNYLDFTMEDVDMDVNAYNKALYSEATSWYTKNMNNLKAFINGDKESDGYKEWAKLSTEEKSTVYDSLKALEDAVGAKDESNNIFRVSTLEAKDDFSKSDIYNTEQDKKNLRYLHQREDGTYYYDPTNNGSFATWDDYEAARKSGIQMSKAGVVESDIISTLGIDVSAGMTSTDLMGLIYSQKDSVMEQNAESWEQARDIGLRILNGNYKLRGLSDDQAVSVANMVADADVEGLKSFKERAVAEGIEFDESVINGFITLAEAINNTDISVLSKLVSSVEEIVNIGKDVGNTVMVMKGTMPEVLGSQSVDYIMHNVNEIFDKDTDVQKVIGKKKDDEALDVITDLLINGGVDNTTGIEISQSSLEALASAVSEGMTQSVKGIFDDTESIKQLRESQLYQQSAASGEQIDLDGIKISMDAAVTRVYNLTEELATMKETQAGYDEKVKEKTDLVDKITTHYLESIDNLSNDLDKGNDALIEGQETVKKTTDLFSSTFEKYDGAIKDAITTMNNTIFTMASKQVQNKTYVTNSTTPLAYSDPVQVQLSMGGSGKAQS